MFTSLSDFFDNILEDFIRLPTMTFKILLSTSKLPGTVHVAFCANLLLPLVSGKIPNYFHSQPTQQQFESTLLTLKGTTQSFAVNAKISLILEQIFAYMVSHDALAATGTLRTAMGAGIESRESVYGTGRGKKGNAEEEMQANELLSACSERMLGMLEVLQMKEGKPSQAFDAKSRKGPAFLSFGSGSSLSDAPGSETDEDE